MRPLLRLIAFLLFTLPLWGQGPQIVERPLSQVTVEGNSFTFAVTATGAGPLIYTWRHNGIVLAENSESITVDHATLADRGWYHVTVSNAQGSATSVMHLEVGISNPTFIGWGEPPAITFDSANPPLFLDASVFTSYVLGLNRNGTVSAWGPSWAGALTIPDGLADVVQVSAGYDAAAVKADGSVVMWPNGDNVPDGLDDVVAVSAGRSHVLALHADGTVSGWGENESGSLNIPATLHNVVATAAGNKYSLALLADGSVVGWGASSAGQTTIPAGLSNVIAIDAAYSRSMALRADGTVFAWGSNYEGSTVVPTALDDAIALAAGESHNVVLRADGTVVAFGRPYEGQTTIPSGLSNVTNVMAGGSYSGALTRTLPPSIDTQPESKSLTSGDALTLTVQVSGQIPLTYQWKREGINLSNEGNVTGAKSPTLTISNIAAAQAGTYTVEITNSAGSIESAPATVTVAAAPIIVSRPLTQLAAIGEPLSLRVELEDASGATFAWKRNGRVLTGVDSDTLSLPAVAPTDRGRYHVTVTRGGVSKTTQFVLQVGPRLGSDTVAVAWGEGSYSSLVNPPELIDVVAVSAGREHGTLLRANGTVTAWGASSFGRTNVPSGLSNLVALAAGQYSSAALDADGRVYTWGSYSTYDWTLPPTLKRIVKIDAYDNNLVLLAEDGTVIAAGSKPTEGLADVVDVAAGASHGLALKADGSIVQWGSITGNDGVPMPVNLTGVTAIAAGKDHNLALRSDGTVVAWGDNRYGQASVPPGLTDVVAVDGGFLYSVALLANGTVVAWGHDSYAKSSDTARLNNIFALSPSESYGLAVTGRAAPELTLTAATAVGSPGETLALSVQVAGTPAPTLQWYFNDQPVANANAATLVLSNVQSGAAGRYHLVATNTLGSVTSDPIEVRIVAPLVVSHRPLSQLVAGGDAAAFTFEVSGEGAIAYEWRHNGKILDGQTGATLNLSNVNLRDRGRYEVTATDSLGASTSSVCYLQVSAATGLLIGWGGSPGDPATGPEGLDDLVAIEADTYGVGLRANGAPITWGTFRQSPSPTVVDLVAVAAGGNHGLGLKADGTVAVWGTGGYGEQNIPSGLDNVVAISAAGYNSLALKADGTVVHWGYNPYGYFNVPSDLRNVVAIAAGSFHSLALRRDGSVVAWGDGLAATSPANREPARFIAAGYRSSMIATASGSIQLWGELSGAASVPNVAAIAVGGPQALVLDTAGQVTALGGDFTGTNYAVPTDLVDIADIAAGNSASFALSTSIPSPPDITSDIADLSVAWGSDATLAVEVTGSPTLSYLWKKNGAPIGVTTPTLTLPDVQEDDEGIYTVNISNAFGDVTSSESRLSVVVTEVVTASTPTAGHSTTLSIRNAPPAIAYQWRYRGAPIAGATGATLTLNNLSRVHNGRYDVVISLAGGGEQTAHSLNLDVAPAAMPNIYTPAPNFAPRFEQAGGGVVHAVLPLPDGGYLLGGEFVRLDDHERQHLARYHADGSLDTSTVLPKFSAPVRAIATDAQGRIYVGGDFTFVDQSPSGGLVRLTSDLQIDATFPIGRGFNRSVHALAVQPDGKVIVGGDFNWYNGDYRHALIRLNADATYDPTLSYSNTIDTVRIIRLQSDGKVVIAGGAIGDGIGISPNGFIARLTATEGTDWDFGSTSPFSNGVVELNWPVLQLIPVSGGGWLAAGGDADNTGGVRLLRLTADGPTDSTFTLASSLQSTARQVDLLAELPTGQFLVAGQGLPPHLLNSNGSSAGAVIANPWSNGSPRIASIHTSGAIRLWGTGTDANGSSPRLGSAELNPSTATSSSLVGNVAYAWAPLFDVAQVSPQHLLVRGAFTHVNGQQRQGLARITLAGDLDDTFAPNLTVPLQDTGRPLPLNDGRILVHDGSRLRRLAANGILDSNFVSPSYQAGALALGPDGELLVSNGHHGGYFGSTYGLIRLHENGGLDANFAADFSGQVQDIFVQSNGRPVLWGYFSRFGTQSVNGPQRILPDGSWDSSFKASYLAPFAATPTTADRLYAIDGNSYNSRRLLRLLSSGANDLNFDFPRQLSPWAVMSLPTGDLLVSFDTTGNPNATDLVGRYFADGTEDTAFQVNGLDPRDSLIDQTLLADDGSLFALGTSLSAFGESRGGLMKLVSATGLSIVTSPETAVASPGGNATLRVVAEGTGPISYQWYRNRVAIAGATGSTLELESVTLEDIADYHVVVTSPFAILTTQPVTIAGPNPAPAIVDQPKSVIGTAGEAVSLEVTAVGTGDLSYQWRRSSHPIPGATSAIYTLPHALRSDAGIYDVVVADGLSATVSDGVRIDVAPTRYPGILELDPTFAPRFETAGGAINAIVPAGNGKFIVSGDFTRLNGVARPGLARVDANFAVDETFAPPAMFGDVAASGFPEIETTHALAVLADGKVLVTHPLPAVGDFPFRNELVRLLPDGSIDATFNASEEPVNISALTIQPDGRIIVVGLPGNSTTLPAGKRYVYRLNTDGSLDDAYAPAFRSSANASYPSGLLAMPDGKTLFVGNFSSVNGVNRAGIVRLDTTGAIDETFAPEGYTVNWAQALKHDDDGKLWVGGTLGHATQGTFRLARLAADGTWEAGAISSSESSSHVTAVEFDAAGRVWAGQRIASNAKRVWRLSPAGAIEQRFDTYLDMRTDAFMPQANGELWMTGTTVGEPGLVVRRYSADGVEGTVVAETEVPASVSHLVFAPDGGLFAAGNFTRVDGVAQGQVARLFPSGALDSSFATADGFDGPVKAIEPLPNGQLIVGGAFNHYRGQPVAEIVRLNADGSIDPTFVAVEPIHSPWFGGQLELLRDGRLVVDGYLCLLPDGTADDAWIATDRAPYTMVALPNGDVLVGGYTSAGGQYLKRLNRDGVLVANGYPSHTFRNLVVLPGGEVLTGGITAAGPYPYWRNIPDVRRLFADLTRDEAYVSSGIPEPDSISSAYSGPGLLGQEDGRVILNDYRGMWRLNANGSRDLTFEQDIVTLSGNNPYSGVAATLMLDDGRLLITSDVLSVAGYRRRGIVALRNDDSAKFVEQPLSQDLIAGDALDLTVTLEHTDGFTFQWYKDDVAIDGATAIAYHLDAISTEDVGDYSLVITGANTITSSAVAQISVVPAVAPQFVLQPRDRTAFAGESLSLLVSTTGTPTPTLQWRHNGTDIPDATSPRLDINPVSTDDAGEYTVIATNRAGVVPSATARVSVFPTGMSATHSHQTVSWGSTTVTITIANSFASLESSPALEWQVLLPSGWSLQSTSGDEAAGTRPTAGDTELLEWSWSAVGDSPLAFTYTLTASTPLLTIPEIAALLTVNTDDTTQYLAQPDPLVIRFQHSADTDRDNRLSLSELLRVIELYNTRTGTTRTGRYRMQTGTNDGFAPEPQNDAPLPTRLHSADTDRDGRLSLSELLRVIELYNTRSGTTRTGAYRLQPGTSDDFTPDN